MKRYLFIIGLIATTLYSCSKEEGEGGKSSISGTISGTEISIARAETTVITTVPGAEIKGQDFFLINTPGTTDNYAVWFFNSNDLTLPPNFTNRTLIQVNCSDASSNINIATNIKAGLDTIAGSPFTVSIDNDILTITNNIEGDVVDADNGISKLVVDVTTQGENQITLQNGAFADEDVFIIYGDNDVIQDDNIKTNYDGTFKFNNLRKGNYTVFAYSKDESSVNSILTPIFRKIEIGGDEDANVGTITIEKK